MKTTRNEIKTWTLEIPYANTAGHKNAKKIGAKWNPDTKVWIVKTSEYKLDLKNLWKFVKEEDETHLTETKEETVDMGVGFPVPNNNRAKALVQKYGFDAIEMI